MKPLKSRSSEPAKIQNPLGKCPFFLEGFIDPILWEIFPRELFIPKHLIRRTGSTPVVVRRVDKTSDVDVLQIRAKSKNPLRKGPFSLEDFIDPISWEVSPWIVCSQTPNPLNRVYPGSSPSDR